MRAFLLAAGRGTRLGALTESTPKCLVEIRGTPLLDIWIQRLTAAGFTEVRLNTHHLASIVSEHVAKADYPIDVQPHHEPELLGTAGTLAHHRSWLAETDTLVAHADNFALFDIADFIRSHKARSPETLLSMLAFRTPTPETSGILQVDETNILRNMWEKSREQHGNLANAAIYILTPAVLTYLHGAFDFSTDVIPKLFGKIHVVETDRTHIDIGTPESLERAQNIEQ